MHLAADGAAVSSDARLIAADAQQVTATKRATGPAPAAAPAPASGSASKPAAGGY